MLFSKAKNVKSEEIRQFVSAKMSSNFDTLAPYIVSSERDYIAVLLGDAQYLELLKRYTAPVDDVDPLPEGVAAGADLDLLLPVVQNALIHLAYMRGWPVLSVKITDNGAVRPEDTANKSLFKYQEDRLLTSFKNEGYNGLDAVLQFLEKNIDKYPVFKGSDEYKRLRTGFVKNASVFSDIWGINNSRLVFLRMKPFLDSADRFTLKPLLGAALYAKVVAEVVKDAPDDKIKALLPMIVPILVYMSVAEGVAELRVDVCDTGLFFNSTEPTGIDGGKKSKIDDETLQVIINRANRFGLRWIQALKDFLNLNAVDYTDWVVQTETKNQIGNYYGDKSTWIF